LRRNDNATVCRPCADAYTTALNRLLHPAYPRPSDNLPMPRRNYRLSEDTTAVFWERSGGEFADVFAELLGGNPDAIHALLGAPWHGRIVGLDNPDAFFVLIVSGAQGRVIVRDWFESTVRDVAGNLKRYFDDLALVKMWEKEPETLPLRWLLDSLVPPGKSSVLPPALAAALFEAALFGRRYPLTLLDAALRRLRAGDECSRARASLIKAVLKRNYQQEVEPTMDTDCKIVSYRLGRLFAVLEKLRQAARGDSNSSQFFAAASTTPVIVFARLLKDAQHHATKAGKLGGYYQKLIEEILEPLDPQRAFPSTLELRDQGMFALGYYHQRAKLWKKKDE
jgi:CRISPR-associated protein Csd1